MASKGHECVNMAPTLRNRLSKTLISAARLVSLSFISPKNPKKLFAKSSNLLSLPSLK